MIGTTLGGRYAILRRLGQGGMGAVYEARHTGTNRRVAVKVITADIRHNPTLIARFEIEAKAAGTIESQYIAQVLDVGHDEAQEAPYMVMEYLAGEDILHLLRRLGPLPPHLALRITAQACLGLEKAHKANIIHRDIKAANLFLVEQDAGEHGVKILDFGIAKIKAPDEEPDATGGVTKTGSLIGSPLYMSPEQARGSQVLDRRSDIWSLGIVLYQLLTGRTPLQGVDAFGELILRICSEPVPSVQIAAPWVAPEIAQIVARALKIDASQRYRSAEEMFLALRALLPGGFSIQESMLVPLTEAEQAAFAPLATPLGDLPARAPAPSAPQLIALGLTPTGTGSGANLIPASNLGPLGMSTGSGVSLPPRRRRRDAAVVLAGVLGAAALILGVFLVLRGERDNLTTPAAESLPVTAALTIAAPLASLTGPSLAATLAPSVEAGAVPSAPSVEAGAAASSAPSAAPRAQGVKKLPPPKKETPTRTDDDLTGRY